MAPEKTDALKAGPVKESSGTERRIFSRLEADVTVYYRVVKSPGIASKAVSKTDVPEEFSYTKNISAGGLFFLAKDSMEAGSILELRFQLPTKEETECLARVIRQEEVESGKVYETGVCFLDLSSRQRQQLEKFIQKEKFSEKDKK